MTWEEIGKKYEQDARLAKEKKEPKLAKDWDQLVRSTDKLVWLFTLSGNGRAQPKKA